MATEFPLPLIAYPPGSDGLWESLLARVRHEPFNAVASSIFLIAILHTFAAARFARLAHHVQERHDRRARAEGRAPSPSVAAELMHFLSEIEVVFGLWAAVLMVAMSLYTGWDAAKHYFNDQVNYTEPLFVVVIMALASTRPVIASAELALRRLASVGGATPAAWWITILTLGPMLGSFITEPAAMTICALLLARQFYDLEPSVRLKYATLGLLFVNVSIGGTLTPFAAPPVLMVARPWGWDIPFMMANFGWRAALAIATSTCIYYLVFRRELRGLASHPAVADIDVPEDEAGRAPLLPEPVWITATHLGFMAWTVFTAHYPALFLGGFSSSSDSRGRPPSTRVGSSSRFHCSSASSGRARHPWRPAGLVDRAGAGDPRGGIPLPGGYSTYGVQRQRAHHLARDARADLDNVLKLALVQGAVVGGGLTVIANAPNPAGQALLSGFFGGAISPVRLLLGALGPTFVAALIFRLI